MTKSLRLLVICLFLLILLAGCGGRYRRCATCNVHGAREAMWYRLHLWYTEGSENYEYDEYGDMKLWEDIFGKKCQHRWHYKQNLGLILPIFIEYGAPYRDPFTGSYVSYAIRMLRDQNKEWARLAWTRLYRLADYGYEDARNALDLLGRQESKNNVDITIWWDKNKHYFE